MRLHIAKHGSSLYFFTMMAIASALIIDIPFLFIIELNTGLEPMTFRLQGERSAN